MRITEARNRPVVDTSTADEVGRVNGFLIEAKAARITGLRIDGKGSGTVLPWDQLGAFGPDAITVAAADAVRAPAGDAEQRLSNPDLDPIGKLAIEETGNGLGTVADIDFDPDTGALRAIITDLYELPADKLIGLGSYAMVFGDIHGLTPA